jgi:hypothetical protein
MDRAVLDVALPVISLCTALVAVSFWRRLPQAKPTPVPTPVPTPEEPPRTVDHGTLHLSGAQLLATTLEGSDLVIDAFGGTGNWVGRAGADILEEGTVAGTPMLTFRASFDRTIDLTALERLLGWVDRACHVDLVVEVGGDSPLCTPTRITITDHVQAVSLLTAGVS